MKWHHNGPHHAPGPQWIHEGHILEHDVCLSCGLYFLRCVTCNQPSQCPECADRTAGSRPWRDLGLSITPPAPEPQTNYTLQANDAGFTRAVLFKVKPPPPPGTSYALSQDGYLLTIDSEGRAQLATFDPAITITLQLL